MTDRMQHVLDGILQLGPIHGVPIGIPPRRIPAAGKRRRARSTDDARELGGHAVQLHLQLSIKSARAAKRIQRRRWAGV